MIASAAYDAAAMVTGFDQPLATQMGKIEWSSSSTVSIAFRREDIKVPLKGFGFIVPRTEGERSMRLPIARLNGPAGLRTIPS